MMRTLEFGTLAGSGDAARPRDEGCLRFIMAQPVPSSSRRPILKPKPRAERRRCPPSSWNSESVSVVTSTDVTAGGRAVSGDRLGHVAR